MNGLYSGSFAALAVVYLINIILLSFLRTPPVAADISSDKTPLAEIIFRPLFMTAVLAGVVAYGVMSFIMTATPVSMHIIDGFSLSDTAWIIQSHVMAMFVPSLFSGFFKVLRSLQNM